MNLKFRNADIENFDSLFYLFEQLWPQKKINKDSLRKAYNYGIESNSDYYLCVQKDNKLVGFCALAIVNNLWQEGVISYIYAMVIDESLRGAGIGSKLISEAVKLSRQFGCKRVELDSSFQREKAHKFYEKLGFEKRAFLFSKIL